MEVSKAMRICTEFITYNKWPPGPSCSGCVGIACCFPVQQERSECSGSPARCVCHACATHAQTAQPHGSGQIISHHSSTRDPFFFPSHLQAFHGRRLEDVKKSYHLKGEESFYVCVSVPERIDSWGFNVLLDIGTILSPYYEDTD